MKFTKMHGLGNDFIIVASEQELPEAVSTLAKQVCDRHFGIGADGLVYLLPSNRADVRMRIFNADGSEPEQCGNAVRCVARYYYERISDAKRELTVETGAGIQRVWIEGDDNTQVRVDMGNPILAGLQIPTTVDGERVVDQEIAVTAEGEGQSYFFTGVSMGNPHGVIEVKDVQHFPVEKWGPLLENHPIFPHKANIEFISVRSKNEVDMRVWERGVGETLACGTGACATLVATSLRGRTERQGTVHLLGGDLFIEWQESDGCVYMTGAASFVFDGVLQG
ncbi:diaminopimelate epimerase [Marininema mesophilum]|uniref:Diaminopimelate epimerase n=1 Tax=Marininema mesophilum TaxID=1048340 RepID=A0A1H2Q7S8_9BACL|nr:diaminopimelate epimerase [Marininema mesophilum]SDW03191.1 diaminopimelate epimerase [Marininema mesophilum]